MNRKDFAATARANFQDALEEPSLIGEQAVVARPGVKTDLTDIARIWCEPFEYGDVCRLFPDELRVKTKANPDVPRTGCELLISRPRKRRGRHRKSFDIGGAAFSKCSLWILKKIEVAVKIN
jgi:hypothetical protein